MKQATGPARVKLNHGRLIRLLLVCATDVDSEALDRDGAVDLWPKNELSPPCEAWESWEVYLLY